MEISVVAAAAIDQYLTQSGTSATVGLRGTEPFWYHVTLRALQGITSSEKGVPGAYTCKEILAARKAFKNLTCLLDCAIDKAS